jgi:hypothetical protein
MPKYGQAHGLRRGSARVEQTDRLNHQIGTVKIAKKTTEEPGAS